MENKYFHLHEQQAGGINKLAIVNQKYSFCDGKNSIVTMMILTPPQMFKKGLEFFSYEDNGYVDYKSEKMMAEFNSVLGSDAETLSDLWSALQTTNIPQARIRGTEEHLKYFLATHHWLKTYPTWNHMAVNFKKIDLGCRDTISKKVFAMVRRFSYLMSTKITWPEEFNRDDTVTLIYTVDGKHCRVYEQPHPEMTKDRKWYSHKFKGPGVTYEVALHIWKSKIIHISKGIRKASVHDKTMYTEPGGLRSKTREGKMGIADGAYKAGEAEEPLPIFRPNSHNRPLARKFSARARARQESHYGRIDNFKCMKETWRHGVDLHCVTFEAINVILQYQYDNGHPLFDV